GKAAAIAGQCQQSARQRNRKILGTKQRGHAVHVDDRIGLADGQVYLAVENERTHGVGSAETELAAVEVVAGDELVLNHGDVAAAELLAAEVHGEQGIDWLQGAGDRKVLGEVQVTVAK